MSNPASPPAVDVLDERPGLTFPPDSSGGPPPPRTRSRARRPRTAVPRRSGTRSATPPVESSHGHTGDVACDHYHRLGDDVDADGRARPEGVPLLRLLVPGAARRRRRRPTRRAWTSTGGWSTGCSSPASSRGSRSTTGTCRRSSKTPAAGRPGTPRTGSPSTRRLMHDALGDRVTLLDHAQRAVVLGVPRLRLRRPRARPHRRSGLGARRHHLMLAHGLAVQATAGRPAAAEVGITAQPVRRSPRPATPRPTPTRPAASTAWPTASSWTRCCAGRTRTT